VRDKRKLTEELVQHLPEQFKIPTNEALLLWWHNIRAGGGLRLTNLGYETFTCVLDLEHYEYPVDPVSVDNRMIVQLDRRLQHPWYIVINKKMPKSIVFFSSQEAMMANLYGDLKRYIDNYRQ
jgi:hypothetical protein